MKTSYSLLVALFALFATMTASAQQPWKVGDYYDVDGKQGVVFVVTPDGKHGKIVYLRDLGPFHWDNAKLKCAQLGTGWYLPTKSELEGMYNAKSEINPTLLAVGDPLGDGIYWSSTEWNSSGSSAWGLRMDNGDNGDSPKYFEDCVRAVSVF